MLQQAQLKEQINHHPLLLQPGALRNQDKTQRAALCALLLSYKKFDTLMTKRLASDAVISTQYEADLRGQTKRTQTAQFDSLAFMEAYQEALRYFEPEKSSFLTYFDRCYAQKIAHETGQLLRQDGGIHLSRDKAKLLANLCQLLEKANYSPSTLPTSFYSTYATMLGISTEAFSSLLVLALQTRVLAEQVTIAEDAQLDILDTVPDEQLSKTLYSIEEYSVIAQLFDVLIDIDLREYPRLFLTNELLAPILPDITDFDYLQALQHNEAALWRYIFVAEYIAFVFAWSVPPTCLAQLLHSSLCHALHDKSIAAYKQVSASAVSQQHRAFTKLMRTQLTPHLAQITDAFLA